jgi:hypothetical protein
MLCLLHNKTRVAGVEHRTRYGLAGTNSSVSGGYSGEVTPDPIPNSEVKLASANGTARVTLWESRTPPDLSWNPPTQVGGFFFCFSPGCVSGRSDADVGAAIGAPGRAQPVRGSAWVRCRRGRGRGGRRRTGSPAGRGRRGPSAGPSRGGDAGGRRRRRHGRRRHRRWRRRSTHWRCPSA